MKTLLLSVALFFTAVPVFAQTSQMPGNPANQFGNGMALYDANGKYHGQLGGSPYNPNSTNNPYGRYGNPNSPDSINNPNAAFPSTQPNHQVPTNPTNPTYGNPYGGR